MSFSLILEKAGCRDFVTFHGFHNWLTELFLEILFFLNQLLILSHAELFRSEKKTLPNQFVDCFYVGEKWFSWFFFSFDFQSSVVW